MEILLFIHTDTYNTCNFQGGGGSESPDLSLWIHNSEIKRIGRNDRCSPHTMYTVVR